MSSDPGRTSAEQLLPLLPAIVRLVARGARISEAQFDVLLLASGVETSEGFLRELGTWARLLQRARNAEHDMAEAVVEALTLRGIPDAEARQAVLSLTSPGKETASDTTDVPAHGLPPSPEVGHLAQLAIGPDGTVHAADSHLRTGRQTVRINISVAADGSGDYRTVQEAVAAAPEGAAIHIGPGVYGLTAPLLLTRSSTLIGHGVGITTLEAADAEAAVVCDGDGEWHVQGIGIQWSAETMRYGICVRRGELVLEHCLVDGGERSFPQGEEYEDETVPWLERGTGIRLEGTATGRIDSCSILGSSTGVWVTARVRPVIRNNTIREPVAGVRYDGMSGGEATGNNFAGSQVGIYLQDDSAPFLRGNVMTGTVDGITIGGRAAPQIEENRCEANEKGGLCYFQAGAGTARNNELHRNGYHGIFVGGQAHPVLENNSCDNNRQYGIFCSDSSGGRIAGNSCHGNTAGIVVRKRGNPVLENNDCSGNRQKDIDDERDKGWFGRR